MAENETRRRGFGSAVGYLLGLIVVVGAGYAVYSIWHKQDAALLASRQALAEGVERGPRVQIAVIGQGPKERQIQLLGDTRAYQTATIYAKIAGYVKSIAVDRGDRVTAGQPIAEVLSEETDRQYDSALSDLENKHKNMQRADDLVKHGWTSIQQAEQAETDYRMAVANVAQLSTLKSYEILLAPFDGIITSRFVDVGALVQNSTTNQTSNQPVVAMADDSRLRVDVYVEQRDVPNIHVGDLADVSDAANSDRKIQARIARSSGQLDPRTRTLFVELEVNNQDHFLVPGSFAYVTLHIPLQSYPEVPVAGLMVRGTRTFVADVGDDGLVHFQPVKVATTDGINASLADGAKTGDHVALNLPDEVVDGGKIQPVMASK
jgi:membrane fusion protein (multidrug efflux system)